MHAVDTNVIVRCLTRDDVRQSPIARDFIDRNEILVLSTVLVECELVMRSVHRLPPARIAMLLRWFAGLPTVSVDDAPRFATALEWYESGMDFADAMHLAGCADDQAFATFDRKLAAAGRRAKAGKVKAL
ncbi:MAG TPA: type II toxin-antitoxin system VapC family toxin [Rhodanobacteraceae bacterium]|nr:type II toxin-antitoxin system VapC family toxin [Rhodanobacteraceae bacterium]